MKAACSQTHTRVGFRRWFRSLTEASQQGTTESGVAEYLFNEKNRDIRADLCFAALTDTGLQSKPAHRFEAHSGQLRPSSQRYDEVAGQRIMGPPTTIETKDMLVFKKTTYRYEEGSKFALFTFKNDELDSKEGNLATP